VTNHRTYIFDLNEANKHPDVQPKWFMEYEFIKEFTEDTSPAGIDKLLDQFAEKPALLRKVSEISREWGLFLIFPYYFFIVLALQGHLG